MRLVRLLKRRIMTTATAIPAPKTAKNHGECKNPSPVFVTPIFKSGKISATAQTNVTTPVRKSLNIQQSCTNAEKILSMDSVCRCTSS